MKKTLMLLLASTAVTAAIGLPASGALSPLAGNEGAPLAAPIPNAAQDMPTMLASNDDDDRDDDDDDDDDCDDDEDEGDCAGGGGGAANPAPAGTVAPPQNGLFGTGAPPKVQVN